VTGPQAATGFRFAVSFPASRSAEPIDGRIILVVSNNNVQEPRFQNNVYNPRTQPSFGIDVDGLKPGEEIVIDTSVFGYPLRSLADLPPGDYRVQAILHRYETFRRGDGHTVKMPMDRGEGQHWNRAPGNLLNRPTKVHLDPRTSDVIRISLDQEVPPLPEVQDTKYVKYVRIQSPRLTAFWGRPMHLGAIVVLPEGFDEHPEARYPLVINQGHFVREFRGFPPAPGGETGGRRGSAQFFQEWTGPGFPRMILLLIQHANPYYDDSYLVSCGTPSRATRTRCMASSIALSQARCRLSRIASCFVGFSNRLASCPPCSSPTRRSARSMAATLFSTTSSGIHAPQPPHIVENRTPLVVEPAMIRERIHLEATDGIPVQVDEQSARGHNLEPHDRGRRPQVHQINVATRADTELGG
jgi:hypothetical protein